MGRVVYIRQRSKPYNTPNWTQHKKTSQKESSTTPIKIITKPQNIRTAPVLCMPHDKRQRTTKQTRSKQRWTNTLTHQQDGMPTHLPSKGPQPILPRRGLLLQLRRTPGLLLDQRRPHLEPLHLLLQNLVAFFFLLDYVSRLYHIFAEILKTPLHLFRCKPGWAFFVSCSIMSYFCTTHIHRCREGYLLYDTQKKVVNRVHESGAPEVTKAHNLTTIPAPAT